MPLEAAQPCSEGHRDQQCTWSVADHPDCPSQPGVGKGSVAVPASLTPPHWHLQVCFSPHVSIPGFQDEEAAFLE